MDNNILNETNNVQINTSQSSKKIDINTQFQNKRKMDKIKRIVKKVFIVIFVVALLAFCSRKGPNPDDVKEFNYDEVKVGYGDVNVTVIGDGVIEANSIYQITPKVTGEILKDYTEVDQYVEKGDLLFVIDSKDVNSSINQAAIAVEQTNNSINQASIAVEQSNVSLEQSKLNYKNLQTQLEDLKIYASSNGYIQNLRIDKGSYVNAMTEVCEISEKNAFEVTLEFRTSNAKDISIGNKASLFFLDHFSYVDAYVTKISDSTNLFEQGAQVTNITLRVDTTGYSIQNARVEGIIYLNSGLELRSVNQAYVSTVSSDVVVANSSGIVKEKYVDEGSYVHEGDMIALLENTSLNTQIDNAEMNIKNAEMGIKNAEVTKQNAESSRKNAQNSLNQSKLQLDNYNITAPISGKIVFKNVKEGDVISAYQKTNSNVLLTIADLSVMKFNVSVDELDITKVKVGQEVKVTIEALENKEFVGTVSNINTIGINTAGTTNYDVTIEIPGSEEIYSGMTVDAEIKIADKENVLRAPLTSIREGDVVYRKVKDAEFKDADSKVPQGYEKVDVKLGLNSDEYVEILSGLSSGDVILVDKNKSSGVFSMETLSTMMMEN